MYRSNGNPEGYEPAQAETTTRRPYVTLDDGSMEGPWCKCQYKNVGFISYKHVGKTTCLYDIF